MGLRGMEELESLELEIARNLTRASWRQHDAQPLRVCEDCLPENNFVPSQILEILIRDQKKKHPTAFNRFVTRKEFPFSASLLSPPPPPPLPPWYSAR